MVRLSIGRRVVHHRGTEVTEDAQSFSLCNLRVLCDCGGDPPVSLHICYALRFAETVLKQPREQFGFGGGVEPDVVPDAFVLAVADVAARCLQRFDHPARLADGHNPIICSVEDPGGRFADLARGLRETITAAQGAPAADGNYRGEFAGIL